MSDSGASAASAVTAMTAKRWYLKATVTRFPHPRSQPCPAGIDRLVEVVIHAHEGLALRIVEIDRIGSADGIESFLHQVNLLLLEGRGDIDVMADAQKYRTRIIRQSLGEVIAQGCQVEIVLGDNGRHAGAPIPSIDRDAVDVGFQDAVKPAERELDFGGRHILALPAERVADTVYEVEVTPPVLAHEVAGAKPDVAFPEHIVQHFLLRLCLACIAFEAGARLRRVSLDPADDLARLIDIAFDAETVPVTHRLLVLGIKAHDLDREAMGQPPREAADGSFRAVEIEECHIAFGCRVEFEDLRNPEALLEFPPYV